MTAAAEPRKTFSINDYPEHLNPFREDDNHNKIRFWTIGRRMSRSNSISFNSIKDLKNSWAFRSFMKKGKKQAPALPAEAAHSKPSHNHVNGEPSPIVYRRALQYSSSSMAGSRSTMGSPEKPDRYVYGGSVTPLPRSRFQERLRSTSQFEVSSLSATPRMARSEVSGSRLSVESTNPFDECPVPPVRASRRKKKRAPPPPPNAADVSVSSENSEKIEILEKDETQVNPNPDLDVEDVNLNVELKIVEDGDLKAADKATTADTNGNVVTETVEVIVETKHESEEERPLETKEKPPTKPPRAEEKTKPADSECDILKSVSFPKVDIAKYRRNSSVNEDDIRLRRGNLEDFHILTTKRSKSLTNSSEAPYITYDINLNENGTKDTNDNEVPQKVICKLYDNTSRKHSIDTVSSTEKEFMEIDKVRKEIEQEVNKLNAALEEDFSTGAILSVSDIKKKFDKNDIPSSPNPIPKPRRSNNFDSNSPVNGNIHA